MTIEYKNGAMGKRNDETQCQYAELGGGGGLKARQGYREESRQFDGSHKKRVERGCGEYKKSAAERRPQRAWKQSYETSELLECAIRCRVNGERL